MRYLWLLPLLLFGCSTADTTGNTTNKTYNITINNSDSSNLYMEFPLDVVASTSESVDQSPTNQPSTDFDIPLSMALQGGTASTAGPAATQNLSELKSDFRAWQDFRKWQSDNDNRVDNSTKPVVTPAVPVVEDEPKVEPIEENSQSPEDLVEEDTPTPTDMFGYSHYITNTKPASDLSYNSVMQRRHVFPKLGPEYGKSLLIQWGDGKTLKVPDTAHMVMYGEPGFRKYQPGGKYSHDNPDIPTMEVYAERGSWPESVTIFFNKP